MRIQWGRYAGAAGVVESATFQRIVDAPEEFTPGYPFAHFPASFNSGAWPCSAWVNSIPPIVDQVNGGDNTLG